MAGLWRVAPLAAYAVLALGPCARTAVAPTVPPGTPSAAPTTAPAARTPTRALVSPTPVATAPATSSAAATPQGPPASCGALLGSGVEPPSVFVCIDEPQAGQRLVGNVRFSGQAGNTVRGDLVLTLVDANGNAALLVDLPRPRAGGRAPWDTTLGIPASAATGPATLRLYVANSAGDSATAEIPLTIGR